MEEKIEKMDVSKMVAGWWTTTHSDCGVCGSKSEIVPKEGHELSSFWRLKKYEKEELRYCIGGCLDGENAKDVIRRLRKEMQQALKEVPRESKAIEG